MILPGRCCRCRPPLPITIRPRIRSGRFDVTVERVPPLTFGGGAHYCLGTNLARAEMQEALAVRAPRMPDLRIAGEVR